MGGVFYDIIQQWQCERKKYKLEQAELEQAELERAKLEQAELDECKLQQDMFEEWEEEKFRRKCRRMYQDALNKNDEWEDLYDELKESHEKEVSIYEKVIEEKDRRIKVLFRDVQMYSIALSERDRRIEGLEKEKKFHMETIKGLMEEVNEWEKYCKCEGSN